MAIIQGNAKGGARGFYPETLDGSLRFNDDDSAYLSWTPASAGNRDLFTWSGWVKRGNLGANMNLFREDNNFNLLRFNSSDQIQFFNNIDSATIVTSAVYRDPSAWYHIVFVYNSGNSTSTDRLRLYVNGERITSFSSASYPALNADSGFNNTVAHAIGARPAGAEPFDGYLAEVNFIDGQALDATSFGEFKNGVWIPKAYSGSYGTNGFHLPLDADANDVSGNGNNWTENNLASTDYVLDSPTNNFATLSAVDTSSDVTLAEGGLEFTTPVATSAHQASGSIATSSGQWYYEFICLTNTAELSFGVANGGGIPSIQANKNGFDGGGFRIEAGVYTSQTFSLLTTDIMGVAYDVDSGTLDVYKNGAYYDGLTGLTLVDARAFLADTSGFLSCNGFINFGQDSSFAGNKTPQGNTDANGIGDFYYAPPAGYLALCTANLPEPAIGPNSDTTSDQHFNTVLYTGNASSQSISVGFATDFTWIKARNDAFSHTLFDTVRGATKYLSSDITDSEATGAITLTSFDSDGFSLGGSLGVNKSSAPFVAWNWKANGSGVSNTDGSITSTVSANTDAGFSIVSYTGNGSAGSTVGHGLSQAPEMMIVKNRDAAQGWGVYHHGISSDPETDRLLLNSTNAAVDQLQFWQDTAPTSSVFTIGTDDVVNGSGNGLIAYCFHSVDGFSKFGSYTGNGNTSGDGAFIYLGFKPAFFMCKKVSTTSGWEILDNDRLSYNGSGSGLYLYANNSGAENQYGTASSGTEADFLSNGIKLKGGTGINDTTDYIYMAFAENPFKYSTAR